MSITYPPQYNGWEDIRNDTFMYITHTPVPVAADVTGKWSLTAGATINGSGYISLISATAVNAVRYIPGILGGHLYTVTVTVDSVTVELIVSLGGIDCSPIVTPGTYTYHMRLIDGRPLRLAASNDSIVISQVAIVAEDPFNLSLIDGVEIRDV